MLRLVGFATWAALAGALIPVMAVLNGRLGRVLGEALHASVILFLVALATAATIALLATGHLPRLSLLSNAAPIDFAGGTIVACYVISVTLLAPRFGVGNMILFVMTAQIVTSAIIDHIGLLGAAKHPVTTLRIVGLLVVSIGLAITQAGSAHHPRTGS
jgi:transporter family-2 protein